MPQKDRAHAMTAKRHTAALRPRNGKLPPVHSSVRPTASRFGVFQMPMARSRNHVCAGTNTRFCNSSGRSRRAAKRALSGFRETSGLSAPKRLDWSLSPFAIFGRITEFTLRSRSSCHKFDSPCGLGWWDYQRQELGKVMREPTYPIIFALALMLVAPSFSAFGRGGARFEEGTPLRAPDEETIRAPDEETVRAPDEETIRAPDEEIL